MSQPASAARPTRHRFWILAVLCSLAFITYLDRICIMRTQGDIERDLHFGQLTAADQERLAQQGLLENPQAREQAAKDRATKRMSWVFAAFVAGYAIFEVPVGWLGDRWGARTIIFRIVLCWSIFTAATGGVKWITGIFSAKAGPEQWFMAMVTIRFLFGVGEAGAYPNISRALGRWFPFRERASALSVIWFCSRLGGALAPTIIGLLMAISGGWQQAFWLLGIIGAVWAFFFWVWFRDRPEEKSQVNEAERNLIRLGEAREGSIYDDRAGLTFRWAGLFNPTVLALSLASFCICFCFYFYITFLPKYLKDQLNVDYADSQLISGLPLLVGGIGCLVGGMLSDHVIRKWGSRRWGRSLIPAIGYTAAALCAFSITQLHSAAAIVTLIVIAVGCQDLGVPSMWALPADVAGRFAGTIAGWMNTAGAVGGMLSPLVAARVAINYGWNTAFVLFGVVYLIGAAAWLAVDASRPLRS